MDLDNLRLTNLVSRNNGKGGKIVVVDFNKNGGRCLTFLVNDTDPTEVPGYPAQSLSYLDSVEEARTAIKIKYNSLEYEPRSTSKIEVFV